MSRLDDAVVDPHVTKSRAALMSSGGITGNPPRLTPSAYRMRNVRAKAWPSKLIRRSLAARSSSRPRSEEAFDIAALVDERDAVLWQLHDEFEAAFARRMLLAERARAGNVAAIPALLERSERDARTDPEDDPFAELDAWIINNNEGTES